MAEAYCEVMIHIHERLAAALVNHVDDIEKQLIRKKALSKYQADYLRKQTDAKVKIHYILKECIQYQLKNNKNDTQFQVLMEHLRHSSKSDKNLLPFAEHLNSDEKSVPVNPSQQETDNVSLSHQVTDSVESGSSGIGMYTSKIALRKLTI